VLGAVGVATNADNAKELTVPSKTLSQNYFLQFARVIEALGFVQEWVHTVKFNRAKRKATYSQHAMLTMLHCLSHSRPAVVPLRVNPGIRMQRRYWALCSRPGGCTPRLHGIGEHQDVALCPCGRVLKLECESDRSTGSSLQLLPASSPSA
jgi:hypothetical protein